MGVLAVIVTFNETSHPKKDTKCLDISVSILNVVIKLTLLTVSSFFGMGSDILHIPIALAQSHIGEV